MRGFKIFHGPLQFVQKSVGVFGFFLGANRLLGRSLHQASDAFGILVMRLRNLGDGWLELRQQVQQLGFPVSRNVFGRLNSRFGLLNVLVSHLCPLSYFFRCRFRFTDTLEWGGLKNNLRFLKTRLLSIFHALTRRQAIVDSKV